KWESPIDSVIHPSSGSFPSVLAFNISASWTIGRYCTASQNYLAIRQLLLSTADLIFFLQGSTYWNKRRIKLKFSSSNRMSQIVLHKNKS
ncbi:hypothetical protein H5410_021548, partial [Solanum commersonii]